MQTALYCQVIFKTLSSSAAALQETRSKEPLLHSEASTHYSCIAEVWERFPAVLIKQYCDPEVILQGVSMIPEKIKTKWLSGFPQEFAAHASCSLMTKAITNLSSDYDLTSVYVITERSVKQ